MIYELLLGLNIVLEVARANALLIAVIGVIWVALLVLALRSKAQWKRALPGALIVGGVGALAFFLLAPMMSASGLGEMGYWVDWAFLIGSALGAGVALAVLTWPASAWMSSRA